LTTDARVKEGKARRLLKGFASLFDGESWVKNGENFEVLGSISSKDSNNWCWWRFNRERGCFFAVGRFVAPLIDPIVNALTIRPRREFREAH
jgi:hypothetical protein